MGLFAEPSLLVPAVRNDLNMRTLETLSAGLSRLDLTPSVLYDFDHVSSSALLHLAEQLNVLGDAGWDLADTEDKKRALLKEAIALHRIKGTPYAVKRALELLRVNATITEWFQTTPQGLPCTFTLDAQVTDQPLGAPAVDAARTELIKRVVSFWKPVSRHFSLRVGLGMSTPFRTASIFSGSQCLVSQGGMLPLDVLGKTSLRMASLLSVQQGLVTDGGLQIPENSSASTRVSTANSFMGAQVLAVSGTLQ